MPATNKESGATALDPSAVTGCVVVVAKCPIPGKSKTRLVPLLGNDGSSQLAKAMLSDVLMTLEHCVSFKHDCLFHCFILINLTSIASYCAAAIIPRYSPR
jgi:glycosyltransferase A (GT-A) superfamily protein (DUF2064 family)